MSALPSNVPSYQPHLFLRNILFATDFTEASERASPYVKALARHYGATVYLAHVYPTEITYEIPIDVPPTLRHNRAVAEERMDALLKAQSFTEVPHQIRLQAGDVCLALMQTAEKDNIDLVVLGTHGRRGVMNLLLGSVAEQVIRSAPCPVLTVAPHAASGANADGEFRRILYATDFSSASEEAMIYALSLAQESEAQLILLHVIEEPVIDVALPYPKVGVDVMKQQLRARFSTARDRLCSMLPTGAELCFQPDLLIEVGPAGDTILQTGDARNADLIVMGARHSSRPLASAHAPWHTIHRVICQARCPVLTVRD